MAKFTVTGEQDLSIDKQMTEIKRELRQKGGSPIDPELVARVLQDLIEGKFNKSSKKEDGILRSLYEDESIIIDACDGSETLAEAKEVFKSGIDGNFEEWGINKAGKATQDTRVGIYETVQSATFVEMFGSLGTDMDKLCLSQAQIKAFCEKHYSYLCQNGYATFFLFNVDEQFLVARVDVYPGGLYVDVYRFEDDSVWSAGYSHRLVVPQLTA